MTGNKEQDFASPEGCPAYRNGGEVLPGEGIILRLDAGHPTLVVELLRGGKSLICRQALAAADEALAELVLGVLREAEVPREAVAGFLYQAGPGSLLGLRVAAMMVEGWRMVFGQSGGRLPVWQYYHAEALAVQMGQARGQSMTLLSDARRQQWNCCTWSKDSDTIGWSIKSAGEISPPVEGEGYLLPGARLSQEMPAGWTVLPGEAMALSARLWSTLGLALPVERVEPLLLRRSVYARWSGQPRVGGAGG